MTSEAQSSKTKAQSPLRALCASVAITPFMKRTLIPIALIALAVGCATLPEWLTPQRVETVTRLAAYTSAKTLLIEQPDTLTALRQAYDGFSALETAERWDLVSAARIAATNGLDWLGSPEGNLAISGGVLFLDLIVGQEIELSGDRYARAFIVGARSGLGLALSQPPAAVSRSMQSDVDPIHERLVRDAQATRPR